jgi:sulfur carrier protein
MMASETTAADETVAVRINGDARAVPAGLTVPGLLAHLGLNPRLVVVEHNGEILRRDALDGVAVRADDGFELVHFVGGG